MKWLGNGWQAQQDWFQHGRCRDTLSLYRKSRRTLCNPAIGQYPINIYSHLKLQFHAAIPQVKSEFELQQGFVRWFSCWNFPFLWANYTIFELWKEPLKRGWFPLPTCHLALAQNPAHHGHHDPTSGLRKSLPLIIMFGSWQQTWEDDRHFRRDLNWHQQFGISF